MRRAELRYRNGGEGRSAGGSSPGPARHGLPALLAIPALALLLAGCGGGIGGGNGLEGPMGSGDAGGQGAFGSEMQTTTVAPTGGNSAAARTAPATRQAAASQTASTVDVVGSQSAATGAQPSDVSDFACPPIQVRGGAGSWQVTEGGAEGGIRYQATLGQFARECRYTSPEMNMRVGIQGRVLLGAKGGPGKVNVPIRLAVVKEGPVPESVWTKFYSVPVEIGPNVLQVDFGLVADDVNFPRPDAATLDKYVVYVGFDPQSAATADRPARQRPAQQTRPKPAQSSAPVAARPAATTTPTAVRVAPSAPPAAAPAPAASAPAQAAKPLTPAAATTPTPAPDNSDTQWIGAPAPSTGTFAQ